MSEESSAQKKAPQGKTKKTAKLCEDAREDRLNMSRVATPLLAMFNDLVWLRGHPRNAADAKKYGYVYALAPYAPASCVVCDKAIPVGETVIVRKLIKSLRGADSSQLAHHMCALRVDRSLISYAVTRLKNLINVVL